MYLIFIGSFLNIKSMQDELFKKITTYDGPNKQKKFKKKLDEQLKNGLTSKVRLMLLNKSQMLPFTEDFKSQASVKKQ